MDFVRFFRDAAPYVHAHRGKTFVAAFGGEAVEGPGFPDLMNDLALLHALGVRLVLVHGARPQAVSLLHERGGTVRTHRGLRVTDAVALDCVKAAVGAVRVEIEGRLSMGLANSPMANARIRVASGNFVVSRPLGVVDGIDFEQTGVVRRVDAEGIHQRLDAGAIVLLSPLGYSITGETFNVRFHDVAGAAAAALHAEKLVCLAEGPPGLGLPRELPIEDAEALDTTRLTDDVRSHLETGIAAVRAGVRRAHLIERELDGGLLRELFTRDGVGTLLSSTSYEGLRSAEPSDVGGLLALVRPLAAEGVLIDRPREIVERAVEDFLVIERDRMVVACVACHLYRADAAAELACVAVHPDYREAGRGDKLLQAAERRARDAGAVRLFLLTTRTSHWFRERGFEPGTLDDLPAERRSRVDRNRGALVLVKALT